MKMKRLLAPVAVIAVLAVAAVIITSCKKKQSYTFETSKVEKGSIVNMVTATGTIEAITSVQVGTQVSGIVEKLYVDFNSPVKKGQILAELDKVALKSNVDQALASLDDAKAEVEYQTSTYERSKALYDKNLIAQADYDLAKYNYEKSRTTLKTSQAQYDRALVNLGYATIYSPIDGVVINRAVDEGQTVAASFSTPEIFTIAKDLTKMQVEADIDETDIGQVKDGQRVEFLVDAYPDETFTGTVSQIRLKPTTTSNVVTYTVIINAPNPDLKLLPGLTANITVYVQEIKDVLTVPYKAVKFTPSTDYFARMGKEMRRMGTPPAGMNPGSMPSGMQQGSMPSGMPQGMPGMASGSKATKVWVKEGDNIHPVPVELGSNDGSTAEVKSGLKEGDLVVTSMTLEAGKVKAKSSTTASSPFMPRRPGSGNSTSKTTSTTKSN
jgi:HlyD family secretion protein